MNAETAHADEQLFDANFLERLRMLFFKLRKRRHLHARECSPRPRRALLGNSRITATMFRATITGPSIGDCTRV